MRNDEGGLLSEITKCFEVGVVNKEKIGKRYRRKGNRRGLTKLVLDGEEGYGGWPEAATKGL